MKKRGTLNVGTNSEGRAVRRGFTERKRKETTLDISFISAARRKRIQCGEARDEDEIGNRRSSRRTRRRRVATPIEIRGLARRRRTATDHRRQRSATKHKKKREKKQTRKEPIDQVATRSTRWRRDAPIDRRRPTGVGQRLGPDLLKSQKHKKRNNRRIAGLDPFRVERRRGVL